MRHDRAPAATQITQITQIGTADRHIPRQADRSLPACWLLAEWPPHAGEPADYWLSTLPAGTPAEEPVRLAKIRWRTGHDYRELKTGLGACPLCCQPLTPDRLAAALAGI